MVDAQLKHQHVLHSELHLLADAAPAIRNGVSEGVESNKRKREESQDDKTASTSSSKPASKSLQEEEKLLESIEALRESLESDGGLLVRTSSLPMRLLRWAVN